MSTHENGDNMETDTPTGSPPVDNMPSDSADDAKASDARGGDTPPAGNDEEENRVPQSRFNEAIANERKKSDAALSDLKSEMDAKLAAAAASLNGQPVDGKVVDKEIQALSEKYGVDESFLGEMADIYMKRADQKVAETLKPLKQQQAQQSYNSEFNTLTEEIPEASHLSVEDKKELRTMAHDPKYQKVPLTDLYKLITYGKPKGQSRTVETGRGSGGRLDDGEVNISAMSDEEFLALGDKLANKS